MSSSRLPGKVLRMVGSQPMLARVIARVSKARLVDEVIVATTTDESDNLIAEFCQTEHVPCYRGNLYDVLDRYYQAAREYKAGVIVRVTADCPMIDPVEIDRVISSFLEGECDFVANRLPPPFKRSSPIGMDTEVCSFCALEQAWKYASEGYEREHVMPYLYDQPERFKVKIVDREPSLGHLRFTVDTLPDLQVANQVYEAFNDRDDFSLEELLEQNELHPEWQDQLVEIRHKNLYEVDQRASDRKGPDSEEDVEQHD